MSVWPSVSQESPRDNGDGNSPAWGVEVGWQLINVQKIESKCTSYFWLLCLSGEESWVGKEGRRWIKGEQKAPGPTLAPTYTPNHTKLLRQRAGPSEQRVTVSYKQKNVHEPPRSPHSRCQRITASGGLHGILEGPGQDWEDKGISLPLYSSGDILSNPVSVWISPLWSLSWKAWSPQCTNPWCWETVRCIHVPL